jgi:hypothetical protein
MRDPYDLSRPADWAVRVETDAVAYVDPTATRRVTVTELSRGLTLYWWVDAATRPDPDADWEPAAATPGDSFRDPARASRAAERAVAALADDLDAPATDEAGTAGGEADAD